MKRVVLMIMVLAAGGLALVFLAVLVQAFLSFATLLGPFAATGSGGIGSVSGSITGMFVELWLMLFPSLLLWRVCASLAAGGEPVMARHRRIHGVALIAGLLPIALVIGLLAVSPLFGREGPPGADLLMGVFYMILAVPLAALVLAAFQLLSAVVAFRILMRGGHKALGAS
jgi:hypothetical protein